jgi:hypothetical protein
MSQSTDQANVLRMYEELGISPEDGVTRLTERYRQRVRELHPDTDSALRNAETIPIGDGIGWLSRSYREALAFERVHGRLPGAGLGPARASVPTVPMAAPHRGILRQRTAHARQPRTHPGNGWRWLIAILTVIAVTLATMPELLDIRPINPFREPTRAPAPVDAAPARTQAL